ncbi:IS110 family transposase [Curtobacterium flaccumfaciens]|uniref:IS110 family transposase n=1 Tax=Curtobacterium flaccumfaciens TaxID=2035 RepID=UPI001E3BA7F5|nr:IS110 family transposase [Curtobacterium allii]MCE0459681.1 IS110 family transposase [Curtobacterium allii]
MPIVADEYTHVIGVDTHARTHTYVIIETSTGGITGTTTFPTSPAGIARALSWINRRTSGPSRVAVEGSSSYGATLTGALHEANVPVVEARPPRRTDRGSRGKSDPIDAEAAARTILRTDTAALAWPRAGKLRSALRVLLVARRSMDGQRTADRNALTALLRIIDLVIDARRLLTDAQVAAIAGWRARGSEGIDRATARSEAVRLARNVLELTDRLASNLDALRQHVTELASGLLESRGVGPVSAAVLLTAYSHPGRVRNEAAFASLAGAAPIPASSGNTTRHRLNRHGDRRLNSALETVARVRLSCDPDTRAYKQRRLAEGKTTREIKRMLKRYIARQIYRQLTASRNPTSARHHL